VPMVRIELYPGRTPQQKTDCARAVVEAIVKHLGTTPAATQVMFVDVEKHDWLTGDKIPPAGS
jgi:4-oxalocrotonate tautomerase